MTANGGGLYAGRVWLANNGKVATQSGWTSAGKSRETSMLSNRPNSLNGSTEYIRAAAGGHGSVQQHGSHAWMLHCCFVFAPALACGRSSERDIMAVRVGLLNQTFGWPNLGVDVPRHTDMAALRKDAHSTVVQADHEPCVAQ